MMNQQRGLRRDQSRALDHGGRMVDSDRLSRVLARFFIVENLQDGGMTGLVQMVTQIHTIPHKNTLFCTLDPLL